ncbi:COG4315 family predicted lipoprotein, partial [Streptomyces lydicus]
VLAQRGQAIYVTGVDPQLVGFVERADGACQVTVAGWPVYFFAADVKPGDLLGQGVGGVWHAVTPIGGKVGG